MNKNNIPKNKTRYSKSAKSVRSLPNLREERMMYFTGEQPRPTVRVKEPSIVDRYRQNGKAEKLLGAVYTPPRVAAALTRWAARDAGDRVLDPACGEGVFLSAARTRLADLGARNPRCIGVDIDPAIAEVSGGICSDFFRWVKTAPKFDVVVGNPPFIRSHLFSEESRALAFSEMVRMGIRPSRLMSTWAPFLVLCCRILEENGRLAMVIPEELLSVGYAEVIRKFLLDHFKRVIVCMPEVGIFPEVQQAVVLLLCDNDSGGRTGLLTIQYKDLEEGDFDSLDTAKPWSWNSKWSHLFLSSSECHWLDNAWKRIDWKPLSDYGRVEVGVVTGDNDFFILNKTVAKEFDDSLLVPVVTSAKNLKGIRFGADDFHKLLIENRPAFLLRVSEPKDELPLAVRSYIETGEKNRVMGRYKCRNREPWYAVPSIWESDGLLFRQAGEMPRLVHLSKRCTATDTIHRVRWQTKSLSKRHTVSFMNTWTMLGAELTGRSYGGGVLELMPSEANMLPLPAPIQSLDPLFEPVDERVRARCLYDALSLVDQEVLPCWMSPSDRAKARAILTKLINRRKSRKQVAK